ncbi:hypothetical protein, partial [Heyndrickxia coagulans]|uniref:hypothetical protein n=1 Tax=Heyndrickxia coagulans TaxID=1398 RepID=UPI00214DA869
FYRADFQDRSLLDFYMDYKKTYAELNMVLPFSADIIVQQQQREQMAVMGFLAALPAVIILHGHRFLRVLTSLP